MTVTPFSRRHQPLLFFIISVILALWAGERDAWGLNYTAVNVGSFGGTETLGIAMNNAGAVVGIGSTPGNFGSSPFIYSNGLLTKLIGIGPHAINDSGVIVGATSFPFVNGSQASQWTNGTVERLPTLAGFPDFSEANDITGSGVIVGVSTVTPGTSPRSDHGFILRNGVMTDLGTLGGLNSFAYAVNNNNLVVGSSITSGGNGHAFVWNNGTMTDLNLGSISSVASDINDSGVVVGFLISSGTAHAYRWEKGAFVDLGASNPKLYSVAYGINNSGVIVGEHADRAALFFNGEIQYLDTFISPVPKISKAMAINDAGQIMVVTGGPGQPASTYLLTPVPEPGSWGLVITPFLLLARRFDGRTSRILRSW